MRPALGYRSLKSTEKVLLRHRYIDENGCWIWTGGVSGEGYGQVRGGGRPWKTHRLAAHLWLGFDPDTMPQVLHKDDCNRLCFNPDHLYVGLPVDNARDRVALRRGI